MRTDEQKAYDDYDGSEDVLNKVADIVDKIGYSATVVETDAQ